MDYRHLLGQNLSHRLVEHLRDAFPERMHVRGIGLATAADRAVWECATTLASRS